MFAKPCDYACTCDSQQPPRPNLVRISGAVVGLICAVIAAQTIYSGMSEGDCLIWPGIGTHFTRDFSHGGFAKIEPGMTEADVADLIGQPLGRGRVCAPPGHALLQRGDTVWQYSMDSSRFGGDWAWLSREVVFRHGRVVQTVKWTYHD